MVIATTTLPIIDLGLGLSSVAASSSTGDKQMAPEIGTIGQDIAAACHQAGMFYLVNHGIDSRLLDQVLKESKRFFAAPDEEKQAINIKQSANFRGYGLLKNDRDWREQIHLGLEADLPDTEELSTHDSKFWQLWGRNQWPLSHTEEFRDTMLEYFRIITCLSRKMLDELACALGLRQDFFSGRMLDRPYLLIKAMSYLPQESSIRSRQGQDENTLNWGVTAHCDWSWLTFLLQDDVGGLEAQDRQGKWHRVEPLPGALVVNTGELLELETGGYLRASPHRVINSRIDRQRFSVPLFVNPALDSMVYPTRQTEASGLDAADEHVHKVIRPGSQPQAFMFGDSEWQRKALGQWCYCKDCLD